MKSANCKTCGAPFEYQPSHSFGLFCSVTCYHKWCRGMNHPKHKEKIDVFCEQCGVAVKVSPCFVKTKRFCSKKCRHLWESENLRGVNNSNWRGGDPEVICHYCGVVFRPAMRTVRRGDGKYCSRKCVAKANIFKMFKNLQIRPTKLEIIMENIINENDLPFHYVGDGQISIGGRCPDFINSNGEKKVIEVFGTYWHSQLANPNINPRATYDATKQHYTEEGYSCLVIWDKELKNTNVVLGKLQNFVGGK